MEKTVSRAVDAGAKRALWSKRVMQWEGSGLTQRAFCAKQGLALSTFQWWRRRLADSDRRPRHAVFLPLPVNPGPASVSWTSVVEVELRSGTRLRFEGEAAQKRFFSKSDESTGFHTRSLIAMPLKVKDRIIGVLEAMNRVDDTPFADDDVELLTTLSAQAAIAIENARLFQQSDLISEMVHELRTPLTSIVAYSELMLRRDIPAEQARSFIDTIYQEALHLSSMTNSFLEISRLQSGRTRFQMVKFDLNDLVLDVAQLLKPQADEHNLMFQAALPDGPAWVMADRDRIRQVLVNCRPMLSSITGPTARKKPKGNRSYEHSG